MFGIRIAGLRLFSVSPPLLIPSDRRSDPTINWVGDVLSLAAGGLMVFAFAPFNWWGLAIGSVAVLFITISGCSPKRAIWRGWLHGLATFGGGVFWVYQSFGFVHISAALALPLTVLLIACLAGYTAVMAGLYARFAPENRTLALLGWAPALWVLIEWLRGWLFTGVTWLQLGYSQLDTPLAGWFPVLGSYGVSFAVALTAGLFAVTINNRSLPRIMAAAVVAIWIAGAWMGTIKWTEAGGSKLRVALVQGNIPQHKKWLSEMRQPTLDRYYQLTEQHWDADLIVLPEVALPDYAHKLRPFLEELLQAATSHNASVLVGLLMLDGNRQVFNSMVLLGEKPGAYHKRHLLPFGEYLPLASLLRPVVKRLGIPFSSLSPGLASAPLVVDGHTLSVSICYEITFGAAIAAASRGTQLLVTTSNDAWFGDSIGPHQHLQIARARSLETGRWMARATNTGITAFIDPKGRIVSAAPAFGIASIAHEVEPRLGMTPYMRWGDRPILILIIAVLVMIGFTALSSSSARRK